MVDRQDKPGPSSPRRECLGTLLFSSTRFDRRAPPLCAGLSRSTNRGRTGRPAAETVPADGDWKYVCVGVSEYDQEALGAAASGRSRRPDGVELPHCTGLEIVSASAVERARGRELLPVGPARPDDDDTSLRRHQADRRKHVPVPQRSTDWDGFSARFVRSATAIVEKAGANARFMRRYAENACDQVRRGGGRDQ